MAVEIDGQYCGHFCVNRKTYSMAQGKDLCRQRRAVCRACVDFLDSIEVSGNGTSVSGIKAGVNEAYFKRFALALAEKVDVPVILVGGHRSIDNMNAVLNEGRIEYLSMSRPLVCEPDLINRWESGDTSPSKCVSCNMCYSTPGHRCVFNLRRRG